MRWPWRQQARPIEPIRAVSIRALELETAKEILAEVFHARPGEVEEMIKSRLEERIWSEEENIWPEECGEKLWPATFCLGD
jgi:hypothetical protein